MGYDAFEAAEAIKEWACDNVNESINGHTIDIEDVIMDYVSFEGKVSVEDIVIAVRDALDSIESHGAESAGVWFPVYTRDITLIFEDNEQECMGHINDCYGGLGDFQSLDEIRSAGVNLLIDSVAMGQVYTLQEELEYLKDRLKELGIPTDEDLEEETL